MQYDAGTPVRVGDVDLVAPFPNRLIYVNDPANENLAIRDDLGAMLTSAAIFLVSGFNAIVDEAVLDRAAAHGPDGPAPVACRTPWCTTRTPASTSPGFNRRVRDALLDRVDIYGLNEDELQSYLGRTVDLRSVGGCAGGSRPGAGPDPGADAGGAHQVLGRRSRGRCRSLRRALDSGMIAATTRYGFGDDFTADDLASVRALDRGTAASAFAVQLEQTTEGFVCCRPGFVVEVADPDHRWPRRHVRRWISRSTRPRAPGVGGLTDQASRRAC